jgi:translation initiation factor IF-1
MYEKDLIFLDATLATRLSNRAFRAVLDNGHALVVFGCPDDTARPLEPGDRVRVELSPFDMSRGRMVTGDSE